MRKGRTLHGITLIELMIAFVIVALGGGILVAFLKQQNENLNWASLQGNVRTRAQIAVETIANELRLATRLGGGSPPNVAIPASPNNTSITFYRPADINGDGRIIDAAGNVEWGATPVQFQYDSVNRRVNRIQGATTKVIASHVTGLTFEDQAITGSLESNEVRVRLTLQETTPQQRAVSTTTTALVKMRN